MMSLDNTHYKVQHLYYNVVNRNLILTLSEPNQALKACLFTLPIYAHLRN